MKFQTLFKKRNLYGFAVEGAKEDLKVAMTWMLKAKSLGAGNRLSKFDEKFEELEQKISSQNLEHASSNEKITKTFDNEVGIENKNIKSNEIQKIKKIVTELEPLQITMKNFESIKKWYPGLGFYEYAFSENELDFIKNITKVILDSKRSGLFRTKQPIPLLEYVEQFYKIVREERSEIGLNFLNKLERPFLDYLYPDIFIQLGFQTNGKRDIFGTISY